MIMCRHVSKTYEDNQCTALQNVNLEIADGEFVLLTGNSGCGKTTLLRLMLKELEPTSGEIWVNERNLADVRPAEVPYYRRSLGVVFQDFKLFEKKTVYENINIARIVAGGRRKDAGIKISSLLAMLGIQQLHKRYPSQLSGGEKQKVCLARAIVNHPTILLADEPTGNLDPKASEEIMQLFGLIHKQGTTVVVATHDPESAEGLYDREIRL